jgi:hypothetical protein
MKRRSKNLASTLEHRVSGYALAATAAGVSLLALAKPAAGKIVYTKTKIVVREEGAIQIDLNHSGKTDFSVAMGQYCGTGGTCSTNLFAIADGRNGVEGAYGAYALDPGAEIGAGRPFARRPLMATRCSCESRGPWLNVTNRYLGLRFLIKGTLHYGWARLSVHSTLRELVAKLTGYAYETIPNKPIIAGKTHDSDVIARHDASLGHLARGAAIPAWPNESTGVTHQH